MSYNPSTGVYSLPAIYLAIPGTVIIAAQHNTPLEDLATANNYARPIIAGGTGSNTAIGAANSLKVISAGGSQSFTDAEKQQARDNLTSARVDVASAATTLIAAANSQYVRVTGTTTITAFDTADNGTEISILFAGSLLLTHNATSLILPGAANVTTAAGDIAVFVSEGGTNWRLTDYTFASSMPAAYAGVPDFVQGLTLSNNALDANNDIDISAGTAKAGQKVVTNSGTFTKRLDANWAAGSGNGGLDTGSKANSSTYHIHSIINNTTLAFDALFSLSATAPTVPSGWSLVQRLGAVLTDASGNIRAFIQTGNRAALTTFVVEATENSLQALSAITLSSVPSGVQVRPILSATLFMSSATPTSGYTLGLTDGNNVTTGGLIDIITDVNTSNNTTGSASTEIVITNSSRQIGRRTAAVANNPTTPTFTLRCHGWTDFTIPRNA